MKAADRIEKRIQKKYPICARFAAGSEGSKIKTGAFLMLYEKAIADK